MRAPLTSVAIAFCGLFLFNAKARAFIGGINTPVSSYADIVFNDTTSVPAGSVYGPPIVLSWNGSPHIMTLTTDPNGDFAKAGVAANYVPFTNNYFVNLGGIRLNQASGNTGYADVTVNFQVEYQLDGAGLAPQPTIYPILAVNGTVQPGGSGFAAIAGTLNYYGTYQNSAGLTTGLLDTVAYNQIWNTPGTFTGFVGGTASVGNTPPLIPFTTFTIAGSMRFRVDPADISVETVPEPTCLGLFAIGGLALLRQRRPRSTADNSASVARQLGRVFESEMTSKYTPDIPVAVCRHSIMTGSAKAFGSFGIKYGRFSSPICSTIDSIMLLRIEASLISS